MSFSINYTQAVSREQTNLVLNSTQSQRVTLKNYITSMSCIPEPTMQSCDTGQRIPFFDSCQLITTWMSNTKFYTDSIKVCHFASANMTGVDVRTDVLRTDDFFRTKISRKHRLPYFLTHGASLCALRARENSAINCQPWLNLCVKSIMQL